MFLDFGLSKCYNKSENVTNYDTPKNLIERRNCILQRLASPNFFIYAQTFLIIVHTLNEEWKYFFHNKVLLGIIDGHLQIFGQFSLYNSSYCNILNSLEIYITLICNG